MKQVQLKLMMAVLAGSMIFTSCKKEDRKEEACTLTMKGLAGAYKLTSLQYKVTSTSAPQDFLVFMPACEKDDVVTLNANGSYTYKDAGTVCTPDGNWSGTWSLTGNVLDSDGDEIDGIVQSYDCKTLVFYTDGVLMAGDRLTFTLQKQ